MKKLKITGVKKFAVRHLASEVEVVDLFTDKVFNEDTLAELDKTVIYDKFSYGVTVKDSFDEVFSEEVEEDQE
jgi:hypothetical protein